ncbi:MAG TPA: FecR domain-containing protein [Chloroflexota bacterium]|nr:FecR domain-containing protein [Chloroflexota bacterium]
MRLAWRLTACAALLLVAIVVGVPLLRGWYVNSATEPRSAGLTTIDGVVFVRRDGARDWQPAAPDTRLEPGDSLRTAANARAFVQLFDQSTVLLYPSSTLRVLRAEQGRFRPERAALVMELANGRARLGIAPPADPSLSFVQLRTPHAEVHLEEGSYTTDVSRDQTEVRVRRGDATAYAVEPAATPADTQRATATAKAGQRLALRADRPPLSAQPLRADLLENGYFADKTAANLRAWVQVDSSEEEPAGEVSFTELPGAVSFRRAGRGHGETLISQQVDVDLWDYEKLTLTADFRVLSHTLSGGGWLGTEYPLMLRVHYRDATGGKLTFSRGFFLHNQDGYPIQNSLLVSGQRLPTTDWQRIEIDLLSANPRPWRIETVQVVAQGWDYHSAVREVHLWAE